jgi:putative endonuclease
MGDKLTTGKLGENLACEYLVKNRHKIIKRNWREKWDEIDIIAKAKDGTLVFVEVKTLKNGGRAGGGLTPEDNMTISKLKKMRRACEAFVARNPDFVHDDRGWRIDLLAVETGGNKEEIRHYENL